MTELHAALAPTPGDKMLANLSHRINRLQDFLGFLYAQRVTGFTIADAPEFEPQCTPLFLERLSAAGSYLEFGSGGSTVLAAKSAIPFVSVDSDGVFLSAVRRKVQSVGAYDSARQTYLYANIGLTEAWGAPLMHRASRGRVARWRTYPHAPWAAFAALPGPHLILVDGRFRVACALLAAKFLRERVGEVLIDDYSERDSYHVVERYLEPQRRVGRMGLFTARADIDVAALDADIETYCADYR